MSNHVVLVYMPRETVRTQLGHQTFGMLEGPLLLGLRGGLILAGQELGPERPPEVLFAPDDEDALEEDFNNELTKVLPQSCELYVAIHANSDWRIAITDTVRRLESDHRKIVLEDYSRLPGDPLFVALAAVAKAATGEPYIGQEADYESYRKSLERLIQAFEADRTLEAKLAILHACLSPVPSEAKSGAKGKKDAPDAVDLVLDDHSVAGAANAFWQKRLGDLNPRLAKVDSRYGRYAGKTVCELVAELRDPSKHEVLSDDHRLALSALRDALLPEE